MFRITKNTIEFIFLEVKERITVYISNNNQVKKVTEFNFDDLPAKLELLKKQYSALSKSKKIWLLNPRIENIEKAPLDKEEMHQYAKWKIQEIVDIPPDDIYYDILTNNNIEHNFYKNYATAVIAKKSHVQFILNSFTKAGISLKIIDSRETAILDFLAKEQNDLTKKVLTFFKLDADRAVMCVYFEGGMIFNRVIELPILTDYIGREEILDEKSYQIVLDKLSLEIQRNVDYLDRQYDIQHFENIIYSIPKNSLLQNLEKDISQYFNVNTIELSSELSYKPADQEYIPVEILASFERGLRRSEHINLIPTVVKRKGFNEDFKKVLSVSLLFGIGIAGLGSYYEWKAKELEKENTSIKNKNEELEKEVKKLNEEVIIVDSSLEKDIDKLTKNKNELIKMKATTGTVSLQSYNKIMKDIAIKATTSGIVLEHIKYNEKGLLLSGYALKKEIFTGFLNNLKNADTLRGKSFNLISMEENKDKYNFQISSENIGGAQ